MKNKYNYFGFSPLMFIIFVMLPIEINRLFSCSLKSVMDSLPRNPDKYLYEISFSVKYVYLHDFFVKNIVLRNFNGNSFQIATHIRY